MKTPAVNELGKLEAMLADLRTEMATAPDDLMERLSDSISELAEEAFNDAGAFPLDADTIERKQRAQLRIAKGPRRARFKHDAKTSPLFGGRFAGVGGEQSTALAGRKGRFSLFRALTAKFSERSDIAVRDAFAEPGFGRLLFGTGGAVDFSAFHVYGTRHMPARLSKLDPVANEDEYAERAGDVIGGWIGERLEAAGAPADWIQQATGGRW
jgi:hypothetical protein